MCLLEQLPLSARDGTYRSKNWTVRAWPSRLFCYTSFIYKRTHNYRTQPHTNYIQLGTLPIGSSAVCITFFKYAYTGWCISTWKLDKLEKLFRFRRNHKFHPRYIRLHQELLEEDFLCRVTFCEWVLQQKHDRCFLGMKQHFT